jgi:hypothetical protein
VTLTPLDFFFFGYIKDTVYVLPLPLLRRNFLGGRIGAVECTVSNAKLTNMWPELGRR